MIFRFERTRDYVLIKYILTQPSIYKHLVADGALPREQFEPFQSEGVWYVLCFHRGELIGLFLLVPQTKTRWEVHACFMPQGYGYAGAAYANGIQWVWENTECRVLMGYTPADNRLALAVAKRAGLRRVGAISGSLMRDGKPVDEVISVIEKEPTNG